MDWLTTLSPVLLLITVFAVVAVENVGLALPSETIAVPAVIAAVASGMNPWLVAAMAILGAILGETVGYFIGRLIGPRLLSIGSIRFPRALSPARVDAAIALNQRFGPTLVFVGRFVAVLRIFSAPITGFLGLRFRPFMIANVLGAVVWYGLIVGLAASVDHRAVVIVHAIAWWSLFAFVIAVIVVAIVLVRGRQRVPVIDEEAEVVASVPDRSATRVVFDRIGAFLARVPFTASFLAVYLAVGAVTGSLFRAVSSRTWFPDIAYGIPSFEAGRWWTPITGTFFSMRPLDYTYIIVLAVLSIGILEWRRGMRVSALYFGIGQLVAVLGALTFVEIFSNTAWQWPRDLALVLDVGPSGGMFVALAAAAITAPSPWRLRLRLALGSLLLISLLFIGTLADLEHFIGASVILAFFYSSRPTRPTVREWRLIVVTGYVVVIATDLLVGAVPTYGPFGSTDGAEFNLIDLIVNVVIALVILNGLRTGRRVAWIIAVVQASLGVLAGILILTLLDDYRAQLPAPETGLALSVLWLIVLALLVTARHGFEVSLRRSRRFISSIRDEDKERTIELLRQNGGGTLSWMSTWPNMRYMFSDDGTGVIALQRRGDVAIALGDPIAPVGSLAEILREFQTKAEARSVIPCLFSASERARSVMPADWRSILVAEDSIVDLPGLEFAGKPWAPIRQALNRAEREGITFRVSRLAEEPWAILAQVRAISESWVGDKGLPEMGFTLGTVTEALDPNVRVALALDADGSLHGVLSWLPVYAAGGAVRGWTLDLMRRRDGGFPPVIEFLIASSIQAFRDEGAEFLSLSGAPLTNDGDEEPNAIQNIVDRMGGMLEPVYGFRSLHNFKKKFNPRHEAMYLLYRDEADLPAIGIALTRAFLPDASTMDLARAGLSLTKRD